MVSRGFEETERETLARMYWAAFGAKLGRVLGPERRALTFIAQIADPGHALCIRRAGRLVAVAGFHTRTGSLVGGDLSDLADVYGRIGSLWRGLALSLLERPMTTDELLVDGIFVAPGEQGRGHGTVLIEALAQEALDRGCGRVRLDVIDGNERARALYERSGFVAVEVKKSLALHWIFGFSGATTMVRQVR